MKILEFGNKTKEKIILIHGFQVPYQVWSKYIEYYQDRYHIIVPIIPGHDSKTNENFTTFDNVAIELEEYVISNYGVNIYLIYGMSMGGVLAGTLWKRNNLNIQKIIMDGSPIVSVSNMLKNMMIKTYIKLTDKTKQRDPKTLRKANESIISKKYMQEFIDILDNMSNETIVNSINDIAKFHITNGNNQNTKIYYFYGSTINELLAKKSAKFLKKYYSNTIIKCFKGKGHCEMVLLEPDKMLEELNKII